MQLSQLAPLLKVLIDHGHSLGRLSVLLRLKESGDAPTMTDLSKAYGHTTAGTTGLVDGMERDGLVARLHDTADRRRVLVNLSPKGNAELSRLQSSLSQLKL